MVDCGATGITAVALIGFIKGAFDANDVSLKIALLAIAAFILSAAFLSIAMIVRGGVGARAMTSSALYEERSKVAVQLIEATASIQCCAKHSGGLRDDTDGFADTFAAVLAAANVQIAGYAQQAGICGVRRRDHGKPIEIKRGDGDWVEAASARHAPFEIDLPIPTRSANVT